MGVFQAKDNDLVEILYLLDVCVYDLNYKGFKFWNSAFPGRELIQSDLENKNIYIYKEKQVVKAMVTFSDTPETELESINDKTLFLLRLAVHPRWQNTGVENKLYEFAESYAKENGYKNIELSIYSGDHIDQNICEEFGFTKVGEFQTKYQQTGFFRYDKSI